MLKRFVQNTFIFFLPLIVLSLPSIFFYSRQQGDLTRLGYLPKKNEYRQRLGFEKCGPIAFRSISDSTVNDSTKTNVLVIGDSFSTLGRCSFTNFLAQNPSLAVFLLRRSSSSSNPFQSLYGVCNGDILKQKKIDVIVIESVERYFVKRFANLNKGFRLNLLDQKRIDSVTSDCGLPLPETSFPDPAIWKFPLYSILYNFNDHAFFSEVYKMRSNRPNLFSVKNNNEVLVLKEDIDEISGNNKTSEIQKLNKELDSLSSALLANGIRLIVLPCPDKFDLYYSFFSKKDKYQTPHFFDILDSLPRGYKLVKSKQLLSKQLYRRSDLYYYDDTHWTPMTARLISNEIVKIIQGEN